ncbi:hypothetical protein U1Q18_001990 [Sarracenia purpurea var. burkii]
MWVGRSPGHQPGSLFCISSSSSSLCSSSPSWRGLRRFTQLCLSPSARRLGSAATPSMTTFEFLVFGAILAQQRIELVFTKQAPVVEEGNTGQTIEESDVGARNHHRGKEVFIGILSSVEKLTGEMHKWSDERIAEELRLHLQTKRYLIVMDDVWIRGA